MPCLNGLSWGAWGVVVWHRQQCLAGVIVGGTRVVYNSEKREASISVKNPEKSIPYLIQSWVESENGSTAMKAPFIITPPLFRLDAEQEKIR